MGDEHIAYCSVSWVFSPRCGYWIKSSMMAARLIRPSGLRIKSAMTGRGVRVEDVRIMIYRIGTMLVHRFYPLILVSSTETGS